jgi:hypothetical protein
MQIITEFNCPVLKWSSLFGIEMKKKIKGKKSEIKTV